MDNHNIRKIFKPFFILGIALVLFFGCSTNQPTANKEVKTDYGIDEYGKSKRYRKNGIDIAYLTGTPYEIGVAHGMLCKREIKALNKKFFELYDRLTENPQQG